MENNYILENGLMVSLDWIAFTVETDKNNISVEDVISMMGFHPDFFIKLPQGARGYRSMRKHTDYDISIMYDGAENMGIHVNITGKGVTALIAALGGSGLCETPFGVGRYVEEFGETLLGGFMRKVLEVGHFTRLDVAIDDFGCRFYSCDDVVEKFENGLVVSKFKVYDNRSPKSIKDGEKQGHTVYIGSRKSSVFLRIYDKQLEQNKNLAPDDEKYIHTKWVRWEMELKHERANELAELLIAGQNLGKIAVSVLYYYFRIIQNDDSNRSRCSNEELWDCFIGNVEKLRLASSSSVLTPVQKVVKKQAWVENQVAPSLFMLLAAYGEDYTFLVEIIQSGKKRLKSADWDTLKSINPELYHQYFTED